MTRKCAVSNRICTDGECYHGCVKVFAGPAEPSCPHCHGQGVTTGVEPVEIHCPACYGTGIHNKLND